MNVPLDEVIYFDAVTHHPTTGAVTDADSTPTFAVYEEATDTDIGVGGNLTKRTSLTGNYRGTFTLSAANGFEVGKWYSIIASATVNSIAGKAVVKNFRVVAAESIAGKVKADVDAWLGTAASTPTVAGVPNVNAKTWNDLPTVALPLAPTVAGRTLDVSATGEAGIDWANIGSPTASVAFTNTSVLISAGTGTGQLQLSSGQVQVQPTNLRSGLGMASANLDTQLAAIAGYIDTEVASILAAVDTEVGAIKTVTDAIGPTGTGLSAIPWNAAWDTEVQSECDDALQAYKLHMLVTNATTLPTDLNTNAILGQLGGNDIVWNAAGSSVALSGNQTNKWLTSNGLWNLTPSGYSLANSRITRATIDSNWTGSGAFLEDCTIGSVAVSPARFQRCAMAGILTLNAAGTFKLEQCFSCVTTTGSGLTIGGPAIIDFNSLGAATTVFLSKWSGPIEFRNMTRADHIVVWDGHASDSAVPANAIVFAATCTNGKAQLAGIYNLTNSGTVTIREGKVSLAATGLDSITATDPGGVASTFPQMLVQLWRRFFKKADKTSTQIKTYADDGSTVRTTQTISASGADETQGAAS